MFKIKKRFEFSASHQLAELPEGHKCRRLHGHNYVVEVELVSEMLNEVGFIRDYGEMELLRTHLDEHYEHRHLNDLMPQPTAELLAKELFDVCVRWWPETYTVRVSETPKTWAEYMPPILG